MRIPGTLKALQAQLAAVGWGAPRSLSFDHRGNLIGIELGPAPPGAPPPPAAAPGGRRVEAAPPPRQSAIASLSKAPPPFYPDKEAKV